MICVYGEIRRDAGKIGKRSEIPAHPQGDGNISLPANGPGHYACLGIVAVQGKIQGFVLIVAFDLIDDLLQRGIVVVVFSDQSEGGVLVVSIPLGIRLVGELVSESSAIQLKLQSVQTGVCNCWVSVKQFSKNDTATACQDWLRSTRLGRGSIKSHVRTVKVLGMGLFAFQERIHLWKGVTH